MPKRKCTFSERLAKDYPYFKQGESEIYAFCKICCCAISIAHKGRLDLEDHIRTEKHKKNLYNQGATPECDNFLVKTSRLVRAAEGAFAFHAVRHRHSHKSTDCTVQLNRLIYHDSDIGREVSGTRTNCEAIVNNVLAPYSLDKMRKDLSGISYVGVGCDPNNQSSMSVYPIVIRYFDFKNGGTRSRILDIHGAPDETPHTVSNLIVDTLTKADLLRKCSAFSGDNCNTNFQGCRQSVFAKLQSQIHNKLISVACPARLINNAFHHGCDALLLDIEYIILKIFNYFSVYAVRTEPLREFCNFVGSEYQQLLRRSETRWLYLFPLLEVVLKFFDALKAYFLSLDNIPTVFEMFFKNEFGEAYLYLIHSLMSVFYSNIQRFERQDNSLLETMRILTEICTTLQERVDNRFIPLKIRSIFNNARKCGLDRQVDNFTIEILKLYNTTGKYLESWLEPLEEFRCFQWMNVKEFDSWNCDRDIIPTLAYLDQRGVYIDNAKFFYQLARLKLYLQRLTGDGMKEEIHRIWANYFKSVPPDYYTELLKLAEFFFAIAPHNGDMEQVHSLIEAYWSNKNDDTLLDSVKGTVLATYNFRDVRCSDFYDYLLTSEEFLDQID